MSVIKFENNSFEKEISSGVVLVDFYADWCGPCKMISPIIEEIAKESDAKVGKVDVDVEQKIAQQFGVMSIPTLIVFKDGREFRRVVGFTSKDSLLSILNEAK